MHVLPEGLPMSNQTAHGGMKVDFDKHSPLSLPGRLPTQLHRPHTPPQGHREACPPVEMVFPPSQAARSGAFDI